MTDADSPLDRRVSVATVLAGAGAFVVLAVLLVPWDPVPGGALTLPDPGELFSAAELARAESFSRWARVWSWGTLAVSLSVIVALGVSGRVRAAAARLPGPWWVQVVLGVALVSLLVRLATLPLSVAGQTHRRRNGLSTQDWASWVVDVVKNLGLSLIHI